MVDPQLLAETQQLLGTRPRNILVTGGTGFVGSHLARCLAEAGHNVTVLGRNRYRTSRIFHPEIQFVCVDIRNAALVADCCAGHDTVYHSAALSSPWGDSDVFKQINVDGTRNVVEACKQHGVQRLVHVSSTSVFFNYRDLHNHRDDEPYAAPQACAYSDSKRWAEELVLEAAANGLNAFTIRARAVFGDGDTTLLPRLIQAARDGRLRQIGDGENLVDLTYIDNLVLALVMAAVRGSAGGVCSVTNGEPVRLWDFLPTIFEKLNIPFQGKRISYPLVHMVTSLDERIHRLCPWMGEPKLTCYTAGLLAKHQVFDLAAAERELGYAPIVSIQTGVDRTIAACQQTDEGPAKVSVKLQCFTTGYATGSRRMVERTFPAIETRFHTLVGLIEHPTQGMTLFDTGYAPRLRSLPGIAARLYNRVLPAHTSEALTIASQLRGLGIDTCDVQRIVISHFHPDHVAGLRDFPQAEFIASKTAWDTIRNRTGFQALRRAVLPGLLREDFSRRLHLVESFSDPGMGPLARCHDLFGDGSIRLFELPGHAAGQMGALVQTANSREFLVADAAWTSSAIRNQVLPHVLTRTFVDDFREIQRTLQKLQQFGQQFPDVNLLPTHCPEVATRFEFDRSIEEHGQMP